jgi:hypothetical protein
MMQPIYWYITDDEAIGQLAVAPAVRLNTSIKQTIVALLTN